MSRGGDAYIGKLRSNLIGTQFTVYDNGTSPYKSPVDGTQERQELAAVVYVSYSILILLHFVDYRLLYHFINRDIEECLLSIHYFIGN